MAATTSDSFHHEILMVLTEGHVETLMHEDVLLKLWNADRRSVLTMLMRVIRHGLQDRLLGDCKQQQWRLLHSDCDKE
jgi:hypothetical protein